MPRPEPVILVAPEGASDDLLQSMRADCERVSAWAGVNFVILPHGVTRAAQLVEHSFGPDCDAALAALPRIADALEKIAKIMPTRSIYTGPR